MKQNSAEGMSNKIVVPCDLPSLEVVRDFIMVWGYHSGLGRTDIGRLILATDEACSNIIKHTQENTERTMQEHELTIACRSEEDRALIEVSDDIPVPYLPPAADFDLKTKIKYRHAEGLRRHVLYRAIDSIQHETIPGSHNKVTLIKTTGERTKKKRQREDFKNPHDVALGRSLLLATFFDCCDSIVKKRSSEDLIKTLLLSLEGQTTSSPVVLLSQRANQADFSVLGQTGLSQRLSLEGEALSGNSRLVKTLGETQRPWLISDLQTAIGPLPDFKLLNKLQAALLLPLVEGDELRGFLLFGGKRNRNFFTADEMQFAVYLASVVMLRLEIEELGIVHASKKSEGIDFIGSLLRSAIQNIEHISRDLKIPIFLEPVPTTCSLKADRQVVQKIIFTLLAHILYLTEKKKSIVMRVEPQNKEVKIFIQYSGQPLALQKKEATYNFLIDHLLIEGLRLSECERIIREAGGTISIDESSGNLVTVQLAFPIVNH